MTKLDTPWLHTEATKTVTGLLSNAGYDVFFVGGCVRNALLDRAVSDLDLTTNARPDVVMQLAKDAGLKVVPTGIEHGTVTVVIGAQPFEITTYRKDIETDGRRAVVAFSESIFDDALRRDFTMNALYCAPDGTVHDPVEGLPDLEARHIRFINDPDMRIREDYLRVLRFFRFTAWYGDPSLGIDQDGLAACAKHLDGLDSLSKERIGAEMMKLLSAADPAPALASMSMSGVLARLLPGADVSAIAPLVFLETKTNLRPDPIRRLAAMGDFDAKQLMRWSNKHVADLGVLRDGLSSGQPASELGYRVGVGKAVEILVLRAAMKGQDITQADIDAASAAAHNKAPFEASDLMPAYQGAALGARIKQLESAWIGSGFTLSKAELLALP